MTRKTPPPVPDSAQPPTGDIVDAVYEVALDPNRYDALVSQWHKELQKVNHSALADHFERASTILERVHKDDWQADAAATAEMSELLLSPDGRVLSANSGAAALLSARAYQKLTDLDLTPGACTTLLDVVTQMADQPTRKNALPTAGARVLRINRAGDDRPLVVLLTPSQHTSGPAVALRCAEIIWPDSLGPLLATAFKLTTAECEIVQSLVAGQNATGIAEQRGTSRETVRTQIRELLAKTGTHSQLELIRMTIGFSMMAQQAESRAGSKTPRKIIERNHPGGKVRNTLITLSANHHLDVYQYGDLSKPPILVFHDEVIGDGFVAPLLREQPELHLIVLARPGYGLTSLLPDDNIETRIEQTIDDIATGLERLFDTSKKRDSTIPLSHNQYHVHPPMQLLAHGNGLYFACRFAGRYPDRCASITAVAPSLPRPPTDALDTTRYAAFISGMARLAPAMLRFAVQAGFAMYARSGPTRFLRRVYGDVPEDLAVIDDDQHLQDLQAGGRLTLAQGYRGLLHDEQAIVGDWTTLITTLPLPIHLLLGEAETDVRRDRARRLKQRVIDRSMPSGSIHLRTVPEAGFFLAFSAPTAVIETLQSHPQP